MVKKQPSLGNSFSVIKSKTIVINVKQWYKEVRDVSLKKEYERPLNASKKFLLEFIAFPEEVE